MSKPGYVSIHGKDYKTVALRVTEFREKYPTFSILTELVASEGDIVIMKALISDENGNIRATGYAEEDRTKGKINSTSALENCETSAIGRALASLGLAGTEYASADEVGNAISQQQAKAATEGFLAHMSVVSDNIVSVAAIKQGIATEAYADASEAWFELDKETMASLWVATTKGGVFTTKEREVMKTTEFKQAYYGTGEENE